MSDPAVLHPRLFAIAPGDPRDKRTWSGTPSALCDILERRGLLAGGTSTSHLTPTWAKAIAHAVSRLYYYPATLAGYGRWARRAKGRAVAKIVDTGDFDAALHFMTTHLPFPQGARKRRNYLYVDTSQRLWGQYASERGNRAGRLEQDVQTLERESFAQMDHIFTISHYLRTELIEQYGVDPGKITVAGSGRGKIEPYLGPKSYDTPKLLYVALNWEEKGGQLALDGFVRARATRGELTMTLVCEPAKAAEFAANPVAGLRAVTGISWEALQTLYNEATLFVMPAPHQPWGLAYLEALACRAPIVGLDRLSTPELTGYGKFGWVLKQGTPEELADIILAAHQDPERLAVMGNAGQAYCLENFGWEIVADHIERQLIADSGKA